METGLRLQGKDGYRLLYTAILFCMVLTGAGRFLGITDPSVVHILTAAVVIALCVVIQLLKGRSRMVFVILTAVFFMVVIMAVGVRQCALFLQMWLRWAVGAPGWEEEWSIGYELIQTALLAFLCYAVQFVLERYLVVKVLTADILISLLLFCLLTEWEVSHIGVAFLLCYVFMVYAEWVQQEWKKTGSVDRKRHMLWIMPFVVLYFLLLWIMPAPEHPYEWRFVRKTYSQISESFINLTQNLISGDGDDFDTTLSGFSEEGDVRDELEENGQEVMTVRASGRLMTNVYLTGKIYDTFNGREWIQENHVSDAHEFEDTMQTLKAAERFEEGSLRDYLASVRLTVRYRYFRTEYLFAPLKTNQIQVPGEREPYLRDGDNLLFRRRRGYGTEYEVNYYQINAGAYDFDQFLKRSDMPEEDEERTRRIYGSYLEDIVLSAETERYLEALTEGVDDPVDRLRIIEHELSSWLYTRHPEKMPEGIGSAGEFLDYFLMESREGYCTHFATAFALLARVQGIPSRYVQGFCVPMEKEETPVYSDMAHAWPEVYLDGVGWIPFEPTPGYGRIRYTPWETEQGNEGIVVTYEEPSQKEAGEIAGEETYAEEAADERGVGVRRFFEVVGYAAAVVCVTGMIFLTLQRVLRRRRYRRMNMTGKFLMEAAVNRKVLAAFGLRRDEKETLQEFRERAISGELLQLPRKLTQYGEGPQEFGDRAARIGCRLKFVEDYEEILYGEKEADEDMVRTAVAERKELMRVLKEKKKWRYFVLYFRG